MAEKVVIADVTINEAGAVQSMKVIRDGANEMEGGIGKAIDKVEERFFSLRHIAGAVLGGFTVAGAIEELKNLSEEILKANSHYGEFEESVKGLNIQFVALANEALNVSAGLESATTWLDRMSGVMLGLREGFEAEKDNPAFKTAGAIGSWLFGQTDIGKLVQALDAVGQGIDKVFKKQIDAVKEAKAAGAIELLDKWNDALEKEKEHLIELEHQGRGGRLEIPPGVFIGQRQNGELGPALSQFPQEMEVVLPIAKALTEAFQELGLAIFDAGDGMGKFNKETGKPHLTQLEQLHKTLDQTSLSFNLATAAAQGFANASEQAAISGSLNAKKFLGQIIEAVGQAIIAYGALIVAEGIATWNAAEVAKGVGIIAGGAATVAIGARLAGEGGVTAFGTATAVPGSASVGGGPTYNIQFSILGNVIGNQDFARQNAIWIKQALADGAAGGSF